MSATMTFEPKEEQSAPILGIAQSMQDQPETGFSLLCPNGAKLPLPEPLVKMLLAAARALNSKHAVTIVVRSAWLTTQEAADMMGYSRQVVVDLIKKEKLKATKLDGTTHRRIKLSDLMAFIDQEDKQREEAMARLVEHTEEFGGYELPAQTMKVTAKECKDK
jgi:excisionase family DNA binding protein